MSFMRRSSNGDVSAWLSYASVTAKAKPLVASVARSHIEIVTPRPFAPSAAPK